jgi:hypothetical protein
MSIINSPWCDVSEDLRGIQDRLSVYKSRFVEAGQRDVANDLERCICILIDAGGCADQLHRKGTPG